MGQNKGARHTAQAGTGWVQAGQAWQACRIVLRRMQDHLGACSDVNEKCDVGDGDERSPHDPDERDAPSRRRKPSRPLAHQTPPGACHPGNVVVRRRSVPMVQSVHGSRSPLAAHPRAPPFAAGRVPHSRRLHPGAFLARRHVWLATACIAARGRAGARARRQPPAPALGPSPPVRCSPPTAPPPAAAALPTVL